jgi:hypothetical protein
MKNYGEEKKRKKNESIKNSEVDAGEDETVLQPEVKKRKSGGKLDVAKRLNFTETRFKDLLKTPCCIYNCVLNLGFEKTADARSEFWSVSLVAQWRKVALLIENCSDWVTAKNDESRKRV